jgi:urea transport system permease protein
VPEYWLFVLGAIFVLVTLYLPNGVLGVLGKLRMQKRAPAQGKAPEAKAATAAPPAGDHA